MHCFRFYTFVDLTSLYTSFRDRWLNKSKSKGASSGKDLTVVQQLDLILDGIFEYWKLKRKSVNNQPLIPLECTASKAQEAHLSTRLGVPSNGTGDGGGSEGEGVVVMRNNTLFLTAAYIDLRREMEKLRNLVHMVCRREKLKRMIQDCNGIDKFEVELKGVQAEVELNESRRRSNVDVGGSKAQGKNQIDEVADSGPQWRYTSEERKAKRRRLMENEEREIEEKSKREVKQTHLLETKQQEKSNELKRNDVDLRDLVDKLLLASQFTADKRSEEGHVTQQKAKQSYVPDYLKVTSDAKPLKALLNENQSDFKTENDHQSCEQMESDTSPSVRMTHRQRKSNISTQGGPKMKAEMASEASSSRVIGGADMEPNIDSRLTSVQDVNVDSRRVSRRSQRSIGPDLIAMETKESVKEECTVPEERYQLPVRAETSVNNSSPHNEKSLSVSKKARRLQEEADGIDKEREKTLVNGSNTEANQIKTRKRKMCNETTGIKTKTESKINVSFIESNTPNASNLLQSKNSSEFFPRTRNSSTLSSASSLSSLQTRPTRSHASIGRPEFAEKLQNKMEAAKDNVDRVQLATSAKRQISLNIIKDNTTNTTTVTRNKLEVTKTAAKAADREIKAVKNEVNAICCPRSKTNSERMRLRPVLKRASIKEVLQEKNGTRKTRTTTTKDSVRQTRGK